MTTDGRLARGERTRTAVLDQALRLATVDGLDGLSLSQVADALGVSKSGLFAHWRSKESLQLAVIEHARAQWTGEVIRPALQAPHGVRRLWALHDRRLFHKDLYLCHFFISEQDTRTIPDWRGRVQLIDLHRLGRHPWTWRLWQAKDLAQLVFSSDIDEIDFRDRLRFWLAYAGPDRHTLKGRLLRWFVMLKWRAYRRHNLKHHRTKAGKPLN